jgi:hypothetical protein
MDVTVSWMLRSGSFNVFQLFKYTFFYRFLHKQKSQGLKSEDLAGHNLQLIISLPSNTLFKTLTE